MVLWRNPCSHSIKEEKVGQDYEGIYMVWWNLPELGSLDTLDLFLNAAQLSQLYEEPTQ
jgi:hypothetical protein